MLRARRWASGTVVVLLAAAGCTHTSHNSARVPSGTSSGARAVTEWRFTEGHPPTASETELRVRVKWKACAGGVAVQDPEPQVQYSEATIRLTVMGVYPHARGFTCQGNPESEVTVHLREPVGHRAVIPGAVATGAFPVG